jgi:hypothetical protein
MKIITLRIDEEEKARLEQLAQRGNITLSRALREGAALYLGDLQGRIHAARGGRTSFHGVRRNRAGAPVTEASEPTRQERAGIESLALSLTKGLARVRDAWLAEEDTGVVLAAVGSWLSLVAQLYCGNESFVGWSWFLKDYCPGFQDSAHRERAHAVIRTALIRDDGFDIEGLLESLQAGLDAMLHEVQSQDRVRRAVLPSWLVLKSTG